MHWYDVVSEGTGVPARSGRHKGLPLLAEVPFDPALAAALVGEQVGRAPNGSSLRPLSHAVVDVRVYALGSQ